MPGAFHSNAGLSPLARGTQIVDDVCLIAVRFIPAGAGNTGCAATRSALIAVYPRWRGEHIIAAITVSAAAGLSPLARGTLRRASFCFESFGFIPAGAGNTFTPPSAVVRVPVYPRWRGEHPSTTPNSASTSGLSPLARGTPRKRAEELARNRFIPAGAGNTPLWLSSAVGDAVYPRWRGEHAWPCLGCAPLNGLSPLARGTRNTDPQ
ncbi:Domain of uncharacterised function (DUF2825) [Raoultella terrigena]|nr:Domain of uncharacterised function (DUF2825) [Raoultella terrigena]